MHARAKKKNAQKIAILKKSGLSSYGCTREVGPESTREAFDWHTPRRTPSMGHFLNRSFNVTWKNLIKWNSILS